MKQQSFVELLNDRTTRKVLIPIIQRDYAQGRQDEVVSRIRRSFLSALHEALSGERPLSLDFVYGEVERGEFVPLDGQQRLTTLFLLHWYTSARAGISVSETSFLQRFTYETRYSSRDFCLRLAFQRPPFPLRGTVANWIRDQSWFFSAWRHDPTIQSMLVVLDDIEELFDGIDYGAAWSRLTDENDAPIVFHVLPIEDMGLTDDLYIKMNSRGKPLTRFEHFKAYFEKLLKSSSPERYQEFIDKIDNSWADIFWPLRGASDIIDDEFVRYFRYVCDVLAYWTGLTPGAGRDTELEPIAKRLYGPDNARGLENQKFLFEALDCWSVDGARGVFAQFLSDAIYEPGKVCIFESLDLFGDCANSYISPENEGRGFGLQRMLLLFGFLIYLIDRTENFPSRLRYLRNLILSSTDELRAYALPRLLQDTYEIIANGDLRKVEGFNQRQKSEEIAKHEFLAARPRQCPTLFRLEDHSILRGCLAAFDLEESTFDRRTSDFCALFPESSKADPLPELSGALLACGDYSQPLPRFPGRFQFGSIRTSQSVWRALFTSPASREFERTRKSLLRLLDDLAAFGDAPISERLQRVINNYLLERERLQRFDWRYYLVKYPAMREGVCGIYVGLNGEMGFSLCMLNNRRLNIAYRDPYLLAIVRAGNARPMSDVVDPWFRGYETSERWLQFVRSGVRVRCIESGFEFAEAQSEGQRSTIQSLSENFSLEGGRWINVPQVRIDGVAFDTIDRVAIGAQVVGKILCAPGTNSN